MSLRITRDSRVIVTTQGSVPSYWDASGIDILNNNVGNVIISTPQVRIGINAGTINQGTQTIAIGSGAGTSNQTRDSVAIGRLAGEVSQNQYGIAIGFAPGRFNQGTNAISIGNLAGNIDQSSNCIAIGVQAANCNQQLDSIAIGNRAGQFRQNTQCIAIGVRAGNRDQGRNAIAIGLQTADISQGDYSIAIGTFAGYSNLQKHAIILDASATSIAQAISATQEGFYVRPIRSVSSATSANALSYDPTTREIIHNGTKTFVIDHPLDENKYLVHACLEGPEAGVYYRGEGKITNGESTEISLPNYTRDFYNFTIQVTPINSNIVYGVTKVVDGKFKVIGKNGEFYWLVHGTRNCINSEPEKYNTIVKGDGPYKYISS